MSRRVALAVGVGCVAAFGGSYAAAQAMDEEPAGQPRAAPAAPAPAPVEEGRTLALGRVAELPDLTRPPRPRPEPPANADSAVVATAPAPAAPAAPAPAPSPAPTPVAVSPTPGPAPEPAPDPAPVAPAAPQSSGPTDFYNAG